MLDFWSADGLMWSQLLPLTTWGTYAYNTTPYWSVAGTVGFAPVAFFVGAAYVGLLAAVWKIGRWLSSSGESGVNDLAGMAVGGSGVVAPFRRISSLVGHAWEGLSSSFGAARAFAHAAVNALRRHPQMAGLVASIVRSNMRRQGFATY